VSLNGTSLLLAIIGHLVGDYLLQNDWMARNKKTHHFPCLLHAWIWTHCVCLFAGWLTIGTILAGDPFQTTRFAVAFFVLFGLHFIQDRTQIIVFWMTRVNRQPKFVEPPMAPWSIIVVDNVWHIVTIWAVWRWIA
jgi:hypothetical protein